MGLTNAYESQGLSIWSSDRDWIFSFERVCEALHIEPDYVRRGFSTWRRRARERRLARPAGEGEQPTRATG
jgi:hypothetical protein